MQPVSYFGETGLLGRIDALTAGPPSGLDRGRPGAADAHPPFQEAALAQCERG
jgi:hypothetical protein